MCDFEVNCLFKSSWYCASVVNFTQQMWLIHSQCTEWDIWGGVRGSTAHVGPGSLSGVNPALPAAVHVIWILLLLTNNEMKLLMTWSVSWDHWKLQQYKPSEDFTLNMICIFESDVIMYFRIDRHWSWRWTVSMSVESDGQTVELNVNFLPWCLN